MLVCLLKSNILGLVWFIFNFFVSRNVNTDVFTSSSRIENLLNIETELTFLLKDYIFLMEYQMKDIKQFLERTMQIYDENPSRKLVGNPLFALAALRRVGQDWKNVMEKIQTISKLGNGELHFFFDCNRSRVEFFSFVSMPILFILIIFIWGHLKHHDDFMVKFSKF